MSKGKILFQLSGSIACYKACAAISKLVQAGYELEVVASLSALKFVGEATIEGLTGRAVHTDTFARGEAMNHINLMKWADLIVLCPASANTINKLANGIGDDLLSTLFLAHDFTKPYLIAPAMNTRMYRHPATQVSMEHLRYWGVELLQTGAGNLACGDVGEGRLIEPEQLIAEIETRFEQLRRAPKSPEASASPREETFSASELKVPSEALQILITSGGTREPIDGVRSITNFSTGKTGAVIADRLQALGHHITYVHADGAVLPVSLKKSDVKAVRFVTFKDLETNLQTELSSTKYDAVIHMAAVSDYSIEGITSGAREIAPASIGVGKIDSDDGLTIRLKRNPKLVDRLREMSANPAIKVIAFKLTNSGDSDQRLAAVQKLSAHAHPDWIVHNDLREIDPRGGLHLSTIYSAKDPQTLRPIAEGASKDDLALALEKLIRENAVSKGERE